MTHLLQNDTRAALQRAQTIERWADLSEPEQEQLVETITRLSDYLQVRGLQPQLRRQHAELLTSVFDQANTVIADGDAGRRYQDGHEYDCVSAIESLESPEHPIRVEEYYINYPENESEPSYEWVFSKGGHLFLLTFLHSFDHRHARTTLSVLERNPDAKERDSWTRSTTVVASYSVSNEIESELLELAQYDALEKKHNLPGEGNLRWYEKIVSSNIDDAHTILRMLSLFQAHGLLLGHPESVSCAMKSIFNKNNFHVIKELVCGMIEMGIPIGLADSNKHILYDSPLTASQRAEIEHLYFSKMTDERRHRNDASLGL